MDTQENKTDEHIFNGSSAEILILNYSNLHGNKRKWGLSIRRHYITEYSFTYYSKRYKKWVAIPAGFEHDGYTMVPDLKSLTPSIVHDYLYRYKIFSDNSKCTRGQADLIFFDLMIEKEISVVIAGAYYIGVRSLGWMLF